MKLTVRNVKTKYGSGTVPMLCDENGEPLPNQRGITIRSVVDNITTLTVEFVVVGDIFFIESEKCGRGGSIVDQINEAVRDGHSVTL